MANDYDERNKSIALWAGFKPHYIKAIDFTMWIRPDGKEITRLPRFWCDLNACFKWLVPELEGFTITSDGGMFRAEASMRGTFWERNNKPAMAFFLAIEALLKYNKLP